MSAFLAANNVGRSHRSAGKGSSISPSQIHIRAAQPVDAEALKAILYDTFESTWRPQITLAAAAAFLHEDRPSTYVGEKGLEFIVAERDGDVAGFVHWEGDFVHALHVHSRHARQRVGARLMDRAEAQIAQAGHASVRLETDTFNQRSQAFYAARGFVEAGRYPDEEWNSGLTTLLLVKPLGRSE
ncbi:MAG TPA: GNAT family N-acetyltransferase [Caulobacteraceae bacterium]|jgi:GNAT superfamily N-acetyltransferase|nr:GNAT family N-acetyltransferase [Caulobacteraceae bacterium]